MWTNITHICALAMRAAILALALVASAPANADTRSGFLPREGMGLENDAHKNVWQAVQGGNVLPLETVLGIARREIGGGQLLEVDLNKQNGVYRLKMLRPNDSVVDVVVDGKTGRVLGVRG